MLGRTRLYLFVLTGGMLLLPLSQPADAGIVTAGGSAHPGGTSVAARPELAGTVVHDEVIPFSVSGGGGQIFSGSLQDRVIRASDGTLSFVQLVQADTSLARRALLDFVRRNDFSGVSTDLDYRTDGAGQADLHPIKVWHSADGKNVQFRFHDHLSSGDETLGYFVKTDATSFDLNGNTTLGFIGSHSAEGRATLTTARPTDDAGSAGSGSGSGGGGVSAPLPAVPLPAAMAAFPLGAVVAGLAIRRMRKGGR